MLSESVAYKIFVVDVNEQIAKRKHSDAVFDRLKQISVGGEQVDGTMMLAKKAMIKRLERSRGLYDSNV
ncbi:MAG: hypothetical protein KGO94_13035 [Alphaproteobacteria bacterium]|nr:hypothetical protein [Alphaproteobacteria bacterium]